MGDLLITGVNGYVGSYLVPYLQEIGFTIHCVTRTPAGRPNYYSWDQLETIPWYKISSVIHLSGMAHDVANISSEEDYFEVNVGLTLRLFEAFKASLGTKFIYLSSIKVLGDTSDVPLEEDMPYRPVGVYGRSKQRAEEVLLELSSTWEGEVFILRPTLIYGNIPKGNLRLLSLMVKYCIPYPFGKFTNQRSLLSLTNLSLIVKSILASTTPGAIFHCSDDTSYSTVEIIRAMAARDGRKAHIWNFPISVCKLTVWLGTFLRLPLNRHSFEKLTSSLVVSNRRVKKALSIRDLPATLV